MSRAPRWFAALGGAARERRRDTATASTCATVGAAFTRSPASAPAQLLLDCRESGPAVLARLWSELREVDSLTLVPLLQTSAHLPDSLLASVLLRLAEDRSSPLEVRSAAMATLLVYVDITLWPKVYLLQRQKV